MKATLAARGINYRRTHDLVELNAIAQRHAIEVPVTEELLTRLSPYAVEFRYAGAQAPHVATSEATSAILILQTWAESQLTA
ncbi:MAG: HEPN domain-containing protein [Thiotrichales bacterium]